MSTPITISLYPYLSPGERTKSGYDTVTVTAVLTNTSSEMQTLTAMTSNVLSWGVEDEDGYSYRTPAMSFQAPHYLTIAPNKSYVTTTYLEPPEAIQATWEQFEWWDDEQHIITDPREYYAIQDRNDSEDGESVDPANYTFEPAVPVDLESELTVRLTTKVTGTDEPLTETTSFTPVELTRTTVDEVLPGDLEIDEEAELNVTTGRETDMAEQFGVVEPVTYHTEWEYKQDDSDSDQG